MSERASNLIKGILIANGFALLVLSITAFVMKRWLGDGSYILVLSEFVVLPIVMGIINTFFWRKHRVGVGACFGYGFANLIFSMIISAFFMGEGYICLLIVSPLVYTFLMLGILIGKMMFRSGKRPVQVSVLAGLAGMFAVNMVTAAPASNLVSDQVVIQASPQTVWSYVVSFPPIVDKPDYWLFQIGLLAPVQSTADGGYAGASRQCVFSDGVTFDETIVDYEPNRKLTFDITKQPDNPEILGHLNLQRGQFVLQDNGDGTTTLIGNSWYELNVKPSLYFDTWTRSIIRHVHMRVMDHIKQLAESAA